MTDLAGKTVNSKMVDIQPGKNIVVIDELAELATGMYSIQITDVKTEVSTYFKITK